MSSSASVDSLFEDPNLPMDPILEDSSFLIDSLFEVSSLPIDPPLEASNVPWEPMLEAYNLPIDFAPMPEASSVPIDPLLEAFSLPTDPTLDTSSGPIDSTPETSSVPVDPMPEASHPSIDSLFEDSSTPTDPTPEASSVLTDPISEVQWNFEEKINFIVALKQDFDIEWIQEVLFYERSVEQLRDLQTKLFDANGKVNEGYLKSTPAKKLRPRIVDKVFDRKVRKLPQNVGKEPVWPHTESDRVYAANKKNGVRPSTKAVPLAPTAFKPKPASRGPPPPASMAPGSTSIPPLIPLGNLGGGNVPHLRPTPSGSSARASSTMDFEPVFSPPRASMAPSSTSFPPGLPPQAPRAPRPFIPYSQAYMAPGFMPIPSGSSPQAPMRAGSVSMPFVPPTRTPLANLGGGNVPPSVQNKRKRTEDQGDDPSVSKKQKTPAKDKQPRWTTEEEQQLQTLVAQGRNAEDIYQQDFFPSRSLRGIRTKADNMRKKSLGLPVPGGRPRKVLTSATSRTGATDRTGATG